MVRDPLKKQPKDVLRQERSGYQGKLERGGRRTAALECGHCLGPRNSSRARKRKECLVSRTSPLFNTQFWSDFWPALRILSAARKPLGRKGWDFESYRPLTSREGREGLRLSQSPMANDLISPIWWNLCKPHKSRVHGVFWSVSRWRCENGVHRPGKLHPSSHAPYVSSIWVFLNYILYNKAVIR